MPHRGISGVRCGRGSRAIARSIAGPIAHGIASPIAHRVIGAAPRRGVGVATHRAPWSASLVSRPAHRTGIVARCGRAWRRGVRWRTRMRRRGVFVLGKREGRNRDQERKQSKSSLRAVSHQQIHLGLLGLKFSFPFREWGGAVDGPNKSANAIYSVAKQGRSTQQLIPFLTAGILAQNVIKTLPDVQSFSCRARFFRPMPALKWLR